MVENSLQTIGGNSIAVDTGWKRNFMTFRETIGRRLALIGCDIHTGELPFRYFIQEQDGPTKSKNKWLGFVNNMLDDTTQL